MAAGLFGYDSDAVHSLLMWDGVKANGLGWLRDWRFSPDNWLLSSVPLNAVAYSLFGRRLIIPILMGWAMFVGSAVTAVGIAARLGARRALAPMAAVLLNMGPFAHAVGFVAYPTSHNTTNLFGLLSILCMMIWLARRAFLFLFAAALLLICGSVSDPWMVATFQLPLGLSLLGMTPLPLFKTRRLELLAALAVVTVSLVLYATQVFGLFSFLPKLTFTVAGLGLATRNAAVVVGDVGGLVNVVPIPALDHGPVRLASFLAFLVLLGSLIWGARKAWAGASADKALVYGALALSAAGAAAAVTIMNAAANDISTRFLISIPYALAIALGVLAEKGWPRLSVVQRVACVALPLAAALTGMIGDAAQMKPGGIVVRDLGIDDEVAFLKANGLSYGYGSYWGAEANALTVATDSRIRLRPVIFSKETGVMILGSRTQATPYWEDLSDAPADTRSWFVMVMADGEECPDVQVCKTGLRSQFGEPVRQLTFKNSTILVWDHPLVGDPAARITVAPGQKIAFGLNATSPGGEGWSTLEPWGVWTEGRFAKLRLRLDRPIRSDVAIRLEGHAFFAKRRATQTVEVWLNGHRLEPLSFTTKQNEGVRVLHAPASDIGPDGHLNLMFRIDKPASPLELGQYPDGRQLGLAIEALTVQ